VFIDSLFLQALTSVFLPVATVEAIILSSVYPIITASFNYASTAVLTSGVIQVAI
jgi:hypothetical protein